MLDESRRTVRRAAGGAKVEINTRRFTTFDGVIIAVTAGLLMWAGVVAAIFGVIG